jgi:hypothetical protein
MDMQAIMIPPRQSPGNYTLRLSILNANGQPLPVQSAQTQDILGLFQHTVTLNGTFVDIATITVRERERVFRANKISHPLNVTLGDSVRLLGYDWSGPPSPGQNARLVLYWQALREMDAPYTVFTHIVGPNNVPAGQKDSWPRDGDYPPHFWVKAEIVSDEYLIPFSAQAAPGDYRLEVGLYNAETMERLATVQDGQPALNNAIVLERFTVK